MLATGQQPHFQGAANAISAKHATITPDTFAIFDGYLDNLAAAATTERTTHTLLIENNAALTARVHSLAASFAALTAAYTLEFGKKPTTSTTPTATPKTRVKADPNGYCWTHGFMVQVGHTSASCSTKAAGHHDAATRTNTMGGSQRNK